MSLTRVQNNMFPGSGLRLSDNPYWSYTDHLPLISADLTCFPYNGFYDTYAGIVSEDCDVGRTQNNLEESGQPMLVPHVRINDRERISTLEEKGYRFLPAIGDAELVSEPQRTLEHLRSVVGGKRYRDLLRLHRLTRGMDLIEIDAVQLLFEKPLMREVSIICNEQEMKYDNKTVVYGSRFIEAIADLGLGESIKIHLRMHKKSAIQVMYVRHLKDKLVLMASATSASAREMGLNLYAAMMIDAINMKECEQKKILNIGRGDRKTKLSYGANIYHEHVHAIKVQKPDHQRELMNFGQCVLIGDAAL